jgi:hypothetical protein
VRVFRKRGPLASWGKKDRPPPDRSKAHTGDDGGGHCAEVGVWVRRPDPVLGDGFNLSITAPVVLISNSALRHICLVKRRGSMRGRRSYQPSSG